jgi:hypothetical protein
MAQIRPGTSTGGLDLGSPYVTGGAPLLGSGTMSTLPAGVAPPTTVAPVAGNTNGTVYAPSTSSGLPLSTVNVGGAVVYPDYSWYYSQILAYSTLGALAGTYESAQAARAGNAPTQSGTTAEVPQPPPRVSVYDVAGGRAALQVEGYNAPPQVGGRVSIYDVAGGRAAMQAEGISPYAGAAAAAPVSGSTRTGSTPVEAPSTMGVGTGSGVAGQSSGTPSAGQTSVPTPAAPSVQGAYGQAVNPAGTSGGAAGP